ncbi:putative motility protein [Paenibacillus hexagrammi]|uniref:Motility protein n=1 Tax=Paenibacillus hexagrammi TaxID=2908839 RepID=A0ABY3SPQ2_9BACL|nr:putative motility protein [Paenibacillus sp. YPD9-1]UJF35166.1 putative motility protein [Paenibacillus sp. YPD9-1]
MSVNAMLSAIGSGDAVKQAVGIKLLSKTNDAQTAQANVMLQDFAKSQQKISAAASATPHLGQNIDVRA